MTEAARVYARVVQPVAHERDEVVEFVRAERRRLRHRSVEQFQRHHRSDMLPQVRWHAGLGRVIGAEARDDVQVTADRRRPLCDAWVLPVNFRGMRAASEGAAIDPAYVSFAEGGP